MTAINPVGSSLNHHILSVLVQNRPGVLARVASLFARRGYNIFSLAVAPAEDEAMSRITIVVDLESAPLEQIVKQLFKLIDVVKISELDPRRSVERELLLATVRSTAESRSRIIELVDIFEAKILAVGSEALTISLEGHPGKLDDFQELLAEYGLVAPQQLARLRAAVLNWLEDAENGLTSRFRGLLNGLWDDLKTLDRRVAELDHEINYDRSE